MKRLKVLFQVSFALGGMLIALQPATGRNQSSDTLPRVTIVEPGITPAASPTQPGVDRSQVQTLIQQSNFSTAVQLIEEFQAVEFSNYLDLPLYGRVPSVEEISQNLCEVWQLTGQKPAFIYLSSQSEQLETFTILPATLDPDTQQCETQLTPGSTTQNFEEIALRRTLPEVSRERLLITSRQLESEVSDPRRIRLNSYLRPAQELYQWIIAPIDNELQAQDIDILVFSMDSGLRTLPLAALHDGQQFLVQKYATALVPSFGLADISFSDVRNNQILAMGASQFRELPPLQAVPFELQNVVQQPWQGEQYLNESFTIENFINQNQQQYFGIVHLATHGEFLPGDLRNSYIEFYNERLTMADFQRVANQLNWRQAGTVPVELLVLSACRTAFGDTNAELGFAGLAVQSGVKSALASLWYVSDAGTLALMGEFYRQLAETPVKAQALQQTQLAMLNGEITLADGQIQLSDGETITVPPEVAGVELDLSHPFFWSAFSLIGNWN